MLISLNVYDVTNTANDNTNGMIARLNSITRDLNLGGVFHGAIQIDEVEWSFGYCESGTGVYCCHARGNSMYTFREHLELGETGKTRKEIREILTCFKRTWSGTSYDLLQRNCCHFCEELCAALDVPRPPAWLNRFAQGADATVKFTSEASALARRVSNNLSFTAQQSASWLRDVSQRVLSQLSQSSQPDPSGPGDGGAATSATFSYESSALSGFRGRQAGAGPVSQTDSEPSCRSAPAGVGSHLASRFRALAGAGPSGAAALASGSSGLPASSHASSSDLVSEQTRYPPRGQQSDGVQSLSLPSALRQKWQELEASAGDGTKQFLFGLIKTRQARLDEDDMGLSGADSADQPADPPPWRAATSSGLHGTASDGSWTPAASAPLPPAAPTQAPPSQVIIYPTFEPGVGSGAAPAAPEMAPGAGLGPGRSMPAAEAAAPHRSAPAAVAEPEVKLCLPLAEAACVGQAGGGLYAADVGVLMAVPTGVVAPAVETAVLSTELLSASPPSWQPAAAMGGAESKPSGHLLDM